MLPKAVRETAKLNAVEKVDTAVAIRRALQMRIEGHDWLDICEELDVADIEMFRGTVYSLVKFSISQDERQLLKAVELSRLEALHRAYWQKAIEGVVDDAQLCLQISRQRAQLMGLNSPTAIDVSDTQIQKTYVIVSPEDWDNASDGNGSGPDTAN